MGTASSGEDATGGDGAGGDAVIEVPPSWSAASTRKRGASRIRHLESLSTAGEAKKEKAALATAYAAARAADADSIYLVAAAEETTAMPRTQFAALARAPRGKEPFPRSAREKKKGSRTWRSRGERSDGRVKDVLFAVGRRSSRRRSRS